MIYDKGMMALTSIVNRHKEEGNSFLSIEAYSDREPGTGQKAGHFFDLNKDSMEDIKEFVLKHNKDNNGIYLNVNPLKSKRRKIDDVSKIKYLFIDVDESPTKQDLKKIGDFLTKNKLHYSYMGKSGHGYHILVPVNLSVDKQPQVKKFLHYLNSEVCDKVDKKVNDLTRIFRVPESMHYKDEKPFHLQVKVFEEVSKADISNNNDNFLSLISKIKVKKELSLPKINRSTYADNFFSDLLSNPNKWNIYIDELDNNHKLNIQTKGQRGKGNNQVFNKNLAIFVSHNPKYLETVKVFFQKWDFEPIPFSRFEFFLNKVSQPLDNKSDNQIGNRVSLGELYSWAKENDMEYFKTQIITHLKDENKKQLVGLRFSEFINLEDKKIYYVKKMFASGTINMIYSPPASMKSFISYYLALCLTSGKPFLFQKTKKVNVGYFDWENPVSDIQNRIKGMCAGMGFKPEQLDNLFFFTKQPTFLSIDRFEVKVIQELKDQLLEYIKVNNLKVLFFDTFRRLGNFDENDSKVINAIKTELFDPIIKETDACIIFLHHTSKGGDNYRGSVDIEGILDTAYSVTKKEKDCELVLKNTKRRNDELESINISYEIISESLEDEDGDMYSKINLVNFTKVAKSSKEDNDYSEVRNLVINNLEVNTKYQNKYLMKLIMDDLNKSDRTAKRMIAWLTNKDILLKSGDGHSSRYVLHPELKYNIDHEVSGEETSKVIEMWLHEQFKNNQMIQLKDLKKSKEYGKGMFDEKYLSTVIDSWNKKGWINPAKEGYLMVTELYRGENK